MEWVKAWWQSSHTQGQDRATWGFPGNQPNLQAEFPEHAQCWDRSQIAVQGGWGWENRSKLPGELQQRWRSQHPEAEAPTPQKALSQHSNGNGLKSSGRANGNHHLQGEPW